ncbi:MAG: hypothetical protein K6A82_09185 [Prevotella sp.]|nr:hypothetical protein [Prevotella sp.]
MRKEMYTTKVFAFVDIFLLAFLLIALAVKGLGHFFPELNYVVRAFDGLWSIGLWIALVGIALYEVFVLINGLRDDTNKFWRIICWIRFGVMMLLCAGFTYWNVANGLF